MTSDDGPPSRPARAVALGLEPHPEGGWYRRTWTASDTVTTQAGTRPAATLIHFLLAPGEASAWHRVTSEEIWLWHGPGVLRLQFGGDGDAPMADGGEGPLQATLDDGVGRARGRGGDEMRAAIPAEREPGSVVILGPDGDAGHVAQALVPAGVWQRTLPDESEVLVSCLVSPGFSFEDWTLAGEGA